MSDEERDYSEEEEEEPAPKVEDSGPSEAEVAMQKRMQAKIEGAAHLDESAQEMLQQNLEERKQLDKEIRERRVQIERRKKEREAEERRQAEKRAEEDARRKAEEEERKSKKEAEQAAKRAERDAKMAEQDKWKQPQGRNFVITKKESTGGDDEVDMDDDDTPKEEKKSKEQLEAEKQAILKQRIQPLNVDGMGTSQLGDKLKELHKQIEKLEGEKYDLVRRFSRQQYDMMELAERARQMNQVGRGGLKRIMMQDENSVDPLQARFAGCPSKIEMYSQFERQVDKRGYDDRQTVFKGATYLFPAEKVTQTRIVKWDENTGLPTYEDIPGMEPKEEAEEEE